MPRDDIFDTGHAYGRSDTESLSTYFPLGFTTDSTDFAYENGFHPSNNGAGWLEDVYPTAANRSAAPPLASNGLGNVDGTHFDRYSHSARRQQQHQFALLATPQSSNNSRGGHSRTPNHRSSFSQSIPTPPDITVDAPSDQLGFRDEAEAIPTKGSAQRAVEQSPLSGVRLEVHSSNQRKTTTHSGAQKQERAVAPIESNKHLSSDPARNKSSLNEQGESPPRSGMVWSGMSVRDEDGQKETPSRGKAGSLASSAQSAQSRSSFNFSRLDRLSESPNVPGVLRLGQRSASQNGQRSLPDEKGFSIQIGSKLFKLSGASIMSDGRSQQEFP